MHDIPATASPALAAHPLLALAADVAVCLSCMSVLAVLTALVLRRQDLVDLWASRFLAALVLGAALVHLLGTVAGAASVQAELPRLTLAAITLVATVGLLSGLPSPLSLVRPMALEQEALERRLAGFRAQEPQRQVGKFAARVPGAFFVLRVAESGAVDVAACGAVDVTEAGADGRAERLVGSAHDITTTRRLQDGLVQTARLATVGTMCAGLAHEASQPLNAATLWLRRMRQAGQALPEAERRSFTRAAQVVAVQLHRAGDLLHRIRELAGEEPRDVACFDAVEPVASALRIATERYVGEAITLALQGADLRLPVHGSLPRLEQAVLQLLSNARDAVQERRLREPCAPARIEVLLRREGGVVAIEVHDSGGGVPEALAGRIFDPFFTTKEPGRGLGLGLPLAASIARAMGGGLTTWNLPGGGACFRLDLAMANPAAMRRPDAATPA